MKNMYENKIKELIKRSERFIANEIKDLMGSMLNLGKPSKEEDDFDGEDFT